MKKLNNLWIAALALVLVFTLCACSSQQTEPLSENADYKVSVKDSLGEPYTTGVIVRFLQNGSVVAMQPVNAEGVATKNLKRGDYTVDLSFTGDEDGYYYNKEGLTLTADNTELSVNLSKKASGDSTTLYADGQDHTNVYYLTTGCTYVELETGKRSYVLFAPTEAGTYKIASSDPNAKIGYYGAPHFVQSQTALEVVDNAFVISISASMIGTSNTGTTTLVIGLDAEAGTSGAIVTIQRTGEPQYSIEDEAWTIYQPTAQLSKYTLPAGSSLVDFDLTASSVTLVYNESDGVYHLNTADGPVVLVRLTKDPKYLPCFKTILDTSPVNRYFFDTDGKFLKKEAYDECLLKYIAVADEDNGVYPLTKDLEYIIKNRGEYVGWFDSTNAVYLFKDEAGVPIPGINNDIAWLFMCCYAVTA